MARSSSICVVFHFLTGNSIPLTMDTLVDGFAHVFNHVFSIRFKLHVHSLLVERKLFDENESVVDAFFHLCI